MTEPAPCKEPAETPQDKANRSDFIYDMAKERGPKVEF
jgi:hypothetical protein